MRSCIRFRPVASAWKKVFRLALPNNAAREAAESAVAPLARIRSAVSQPKAVAA